MTFHHLKRTRYSFLCLAIAFISSHTQSLSHGKPFFQPRDLSAIPRPNRLSLFPLHMTCPLSRIFIFPSTFGWLFLLYPTHSLSPPSKAFHDLPQGGLIFFCAPFTSSIKPLHLQQHLLSPQQSSFLRAETLTQWIFVEMVNKWNRLVFPRGAWS